MQARSNPSKCQTASDTSFNDNFINQQTLAHSSPMESSHKRQDAQIWASRTLTQREKREISLCKTQNDVFESYSLLCSVFLSNLVDHASADFLLRGAGVSSLLILETNKNKH